MKPSRSFTHRGAHRHRRMILLSSLALSFAAVVAALAVAASGGGGEGKVAAPAQPQAAAGRALNGLFTLWSTTASDDACALPPGYDDVVAGALVVVRDDGGAVVARGGLSAGTARPERNGCSFSFSIAGLPEAAAYNVEIGRRGGLTYSRGDLESMGWKVAINLGVQGANGARVQAGQP